MGLISLLFNKKQNKFLTNHLRQTCNTAGSLLACSIPRCSILCSAPHKVKLWQRGQIYVWLLSKMGGQLPLFYSLRKVDNSQT